MTGKKAINCIELLLVSIFVAVFFILFFSKGTTPFRKEYWGWDSAFFIIVGQGMTKGMLPYRDFFDMKGPYLFFLQYIGQLICYGRMGAFIIQAVNLSASFFITGKISDLYAKDHIWIHRLLMFLIVPLIMIVTVTDGNLTEEYCITPVLLSIYFCLKYFKKAEENNDYKHPLIYSLLNGFGIGYICFFRINNAAAIGAVLLTVFVFLLSKKEIKNAFLNFCALMSGFALASAIPCIYFYSKNLLREMLYQVFIFGLTYSSEEGLAEKLVVLIIKHKFFVLFLFLPPVICFVLREKWYYKLLSISSAVLVFFAILMGNNYHHYFTIMVPCLVFGAAVAFKNNVTDIKVSRNKICIFCAAAVIALNFLRIGRSAGQFMFTLSSVVVENNGGKTDIVTEKLLSIPWYGRNVHKSEINEPAIKAASFIPDNEKDSVYGFGDFYWSKWYGITGTLPANKYMDWQPHYIELMPDLKYEIADWINDEGCLWIVTYKAVDYHVEEIDEAIEANYSKVYENSDYVLFHRNV